MPPISFFRGLNDHQMGDMVEVKMNSSKPSSMSNLVVSFSDLSLPHKSNWLRGRSIHPFESTITKGMRRWKAFAPYHLTLHCISVEIANSPSRKQRGHKNSKLMKHIVWQVLEECRANVVSDALFLCMPFDKWNERSIKRTVGGKTLGPLNMITGMHSRAMWLIPQVWFS